MNDETTYTVTITHHASGDLNVTVTEAGSSESDRAAIAWALREAAQMVENGHLVERGLFS